MSWMINILLPVENIVSLFNEIEDAKRFPVPTGIGLEFSEEAHVRVRDADPDDGTDISISDWPEELGWRIYDFLAERTTANMYMMDEGGLLLTARGLTPEDVGLELAVNRVPSLISTIEEDGSAYQWRPKPNPRSGTLT